MVAVNEPLLMPVVPCAATLLEELVGRGTDEVWPRACEPSEVSGPPTSKVEGCGPLTSHPAPRPRGPAFPAFAGPRGCRGQTAVIVYSLLVLPLTAHMSVAEPVVVLPMPSRAVPVPRLTMW